MHLALPNRPSSLSSRWLEQAVFGLDRWLRRREGIYEYSHDDHCLFRIQRAKSNTRLTLSDGTTIAEGDPIIALHLWNEHMPAMPRSGPTIAWAHQIDRAFDLSLRELARYLATDPQVRDVVAIRADLRLGAADFNVKLARITAHFGFEALRTEPDSAGALHRLGEGILIFLLLLAANPAAIRRPALSREHKLAYLSRAMLERRYASVDNSQARKGHNRPC